MKSNHEDHQEHKDKIERVTRSFLCDLRALRGDPPEADCIKGKEISINKLEAISKL